MIYLDSAATSFPKPQRVTSRMMWAMGNCGNPNRGGYAFAQNSQEKIYQCRCELAKLFNVSNEENIIFTNNATHSLNIAIKSIMDQGGHIVTSGYEHNSAIRPIMSLDNVTCSIGYSKVFDSQDAYNSITSLVRQDAKCLMINHVSNVFGNEMPIAQINDFCKGKNIPIILDISQSAGCEKIDFEKLSQVEFMCMPGHKGLFGPSGTGVLICRNSERAKSIIQGGTGSKSALLVQPDFLPDMLESGTPNFVGIVGLLEGVKFVREMGEEKIGQYKRELIEYFACNFPKNENYKLFYDKDQKSLISFTAFEKNNDVFYHLTNNNICIRNGLHCSPLAHKSANTQDYGTLRVSFSPFNSKRDVDKLLTCLKKL